MTDDDAPKRMRWAKYGLLMGATVLVLGIAGQWWCTRPKKTAEHFVDVVCSGEFEEAREMMLDANAIQIADNDDVMITALDKSTITLVAGRRRLVSGGRDASARGGGIYRYLGGPYDFEVAAFLKDANGDQEYVVELYGEAIGGKIVINTVDR